MACGKYMDTRTAPRTKPVAVAAGVVIFLLLFGVLPLCCHSQHSDTAKDIRGILEGAEDFRGFLIELAKIVTGTDIIKDQTSLKVEPRPSMNMARLLATVRNKIEEMLQEKQAAVQNLKAAAEEAMKRYGPYKEFIDFKDVDYFNAKKVVIEKDIHTMDEASKEEIKQTINYLPTRPTWNFKIQEDKKPQLNSNTSSIHVPTNIYDKSMKILNGVQWTSNLTDQFVENTRRDPTLAWQYFCSSDGFFRVFPGMQWPRYADQVDTFDCRIRKWYIQAATSPKNILILLDSSGSMKGLRFSIARSTVTKILETLSDEDYFNVIEFSDEPKYVDECFNGTMMPASMDNIKRIEEKIEELKPKQFANFEKALSRAFKLFQKEEMENNGQYLCNKAIMIITDGAPENYDSVFHRFNWPEKMIRVFTFLIGKEVPDNRQTRWMACANKGKFAHISTRADVQENVQKYIKVLSRPLAIKRAPHMVWSPVYLDYVTEKGDVTVPLSSPAGLDVDYEQFANYEGLGLVMSFSMPVFDERDKVGPKEEEPQRNLLGVAGTDVRVNDLMKLIPTFELGVNGYAFAITNHGYILFHPDYRPFYSEGKYGLEQLLKPRPKYNSVELSEVELPVTSGGGWNKEHPLRQYLLTSRSGGDNMTTISVLTHCDGMKRAKERRNHYQFMEVANTFRLVFVVPDRYGTHEIKVEDSAIPSLRDVVNYSVDPEIRTDMSKWIYCFSPTRRTFVQLDALLLHHYLLNGTLLHECGNREHMRRLLKDMELSLEYVRVWQGTQSRYVKKRRENLYVKEYDRCWGDSKVTAKEILMKKMCFYHAHLSYGIGTIWIGTSSGLTRFLPFDDRAIEWADNNLETIKSLYYKRAVDGWEEGYKYVFTGPVVSSQKELHFNTSVVTMSTAEIVGTPQTGQVPAAVVALNMKLSAFYNKFVQYTFHCPNDDDCPYTCNDTEHFLCYLIDNNGYILATNNPDRNGTGLFLGQHNGRLLRALLDDKIFTQLKLADYQSICETRRKSDSESASSYVMNPLKLITRIFFWLISEAALFLTEWNLFTYFKPCSSYGYEDFGNAGECGDWIPEQVARYLYCGFVVDEATGDRPITNYITSKRSCEQSVTRYSLDRRALQRRRRRNHIPDCFTQCASRHHIAYEARWLNDTNLVFVVADAGCNCNRSYSQGDEVDESPSLYKFRVKPKEVHYDEDTHCQVLLNYSNELKRVDNTRTRETLCLDSSNETDKPCSSGQAMTFTPVSAKIPLLLAVLSLVTP